MGIISWIKNHKIETIIISVLFLLGLILIFRPTLFCIIDCDRFQKTSNKIIKSTVIVKLKVPIPETPAIREDFFLGTGFIVDKRGYVITTTHNLDKPSELSGIPKNDLISKYAYIELKSDDGKKTDLKVREIENDNLERKDILLFKIEDDINSPLHPVKIAKKEEVPPSGADIGFIGYATTGRTLYPVLFVSRGTLSNNQVDVEGQTDQFYTLSAIATFGYSGGPVFMSKSGKVIGIIEQITGDLAGKTGIVMVPPVHDVPDIIENNEISENFLANN